MMSDYVNPVFLSLFKKSQSRIHQLNQCLLKFLVSNKFLIDCYSLIIIIIVIEFM